MGQKLKKLLFHQVNYLISFVNCRLQKIPREIKERKTSRVNLVFKDIHKKKRCFILGNGPSLKKQNLATLKTEYTFATNHLFLHKDYNKIHPNYYCLMDPYYFQRNLFSSRFIKSLVKKLHKDTWLFLSFDGLGLEKNRSLKDHKKYYLYMNHQFNEKMKFNLEVDKPIPYLINVMLSCLILAIYMGFSEIYLLGCDHDWLKHKISEKEETFYGTYSRRLNSYEAKVNQANRLFQAYRLIKKKYPQIKIYNSTPGSYLDIFEYKKFEKVIS